MRVDVIGLAMGMVTIPMFLLTLAAPVGGVWLLVASGGVPLVVGGVAAGVLGFVLARLIEAGVAWLDEIAVEVRARAGSLVGHLAGFVCAAVPMAVLLGWEFAAFRLLVAEPHPAPAVARWLWCYGVATGPWTLFAVRVGSDRRTLCSIRAYAGHIGFWLLSAAWAGGMPLPAAAWLMLAPAALPLTVGTLLAIADRDALRNVRI